MVATHQKNTTLDIIDRTSLMSFILAKSSSKPFLKFASGIALYEISRFGKNWYPNF